MSCSQDSYYTTDSTMGKGNSTCGACKGFYSYCQTYGKSGSGQTNCCPSGYHYSGNRTNCGDCEYGLLKTAGTQYKCLPDEPSMNQTSKINCCSDQNIPNNNRNGYCGTGWCKNSQNCSTFMTNYCQGDNLATSQCQQFCRNNLGACDSALKTYCAIPKNFTQVGQNTVCGCAMPPDQYLLSKVKTSSGLGIPIACDARCGANANAVKLQGQQDCEIGSICISEVSDVTINEVQAQLQSGVTINQNCGNNPSNGGGGGGQPSNGGGTTTNTLYQRFTNYISTTQGKVVLGVIIFIIILLLILLIWLLTRSKKDSSTTDVEISDAVSDASSE